MPTTWSALYNDLDASDQIRSIEAWWKELQRDQWGPHNRDALLDALASALNFRPQKVRRLPQEKLIDFFRRHCHQVFHPVDWALLFRCFYQAHRSRIMVRFLDRLQIMHDGNGMLSERNATGTISISVSWTP